MSRGIFYLLTGPSHGARLAVSLWSLRQYYDGPVTLYTTQPESHEIGRRCAEDGRLRVEHRTYSEINAGRNSAFLTKLALLRDVPYEVAIHFDCDTMVRGEIGPLFEAAEASEFCATQFANWHTGKLVIRRRIEPWRQVRPPASYSAEDYATLLRTALEPHPAVNGGVFGFHRDASLLAPWYELAFAGRERFICDEISLQLLLPRFPHAILDCRFNCSPLYAANQDDVRVWHFHGEKHLSRPAARALWWPAYTACVAHNVAMIREWTPAKDRDLARLV